MQNGDILISKAPNLRCEIHVSLLNAKTQKVCEAQENLNKF